jgi:hypothetical protein
MTWWRRLVLYLAKRELASLREEFAAACVQAGLEASGAELRAFLKGHAAGCQQAMDEVNRVVSERMGGAVDFINPEDVRQARKGMLH